MKIEKVSFSNMRVGVMFLSCIQDSGKHRGFRTSGGLLERRRRRLPYRISGGVYMANNQFGIVIRKIDRKRMTNDDPNEIRFNMRIMKT